MLPVMVDWDVMMMVVIKTTRMSIPRVTLTVAIMMMQISMVILRSPAVQVRRLEPR